MSKSSFIAIITALSALFLSDPVPAENELASQASPHLLTHANSPINWQPWSEKAFAQARRENKPIYLSSGYNSCHWSTKMLVESFNDPQLAELINKHFIAVKLDRYEFPEVDGLYLIYMNATQGDGAWPVNVWLTPDLLPFSGGSYFPSESIGETSSLSTVVTHIAEQWARHPDYLKQQCRRDFTSIQEALQALPPPLAPTTPPSQRLHLRTYESLSGIFDPEHGGFGSVPRFPSPEIIRSLRLITSFEKAGSFRAQQSKKMITRTLDKMADGAIRDQLGGGFHRYSTDHAWTIPRFEKQLEIQANLITAYLDGYALTHDPRHLEIAKNTIDYVTSQLAAPTGGFYTGEHADSLAPSGQSEEGSYYTWTLEQLTAASSKDAEILAFHYGISSVGNFQPTPSQPKTNTLHIANDLASVARRFALSESAAQQALTRGKASLRAARAKRPTPLLDQQIITTSNALMVSALAQAATITGESKYLRAATETLNFIKATCYDKKTNRLRRIGRDTLPVYDGNATDYALVIQACLDLHHADLDTSWVLFAEQLQQVQDRLFYDRRNSGYFNTSHLRSDIILRLKEHRAANSPNPVSILNLIRLGTLLDDSDHLEKARRSLYCFSGAFALAAPQTPHILAADHLLNSPPKLIIVTGSADSPATKSLIRAAQKNQTLGQTLLHVSPDTLEQPFVQALPKLLQFKANAAQPAAYICTDFSPGSPITDPVVLTAALNP